MTWVKLDDGFADHPKIEQAGPLAAWLHVTALCYCARHNTDGHVPKSKVSRLADVPQLTRRIEALLAVGLWHENGDSYVIHDYLDYQPSRAQVEAERAKARDRMAKARTGKGSQNVRPNIDRSSGNRGSGNPDPTRPDPSTDVGKGVTTSSPVTASGSRSLALDLAAARHPATPSPAGFDEFWAVYPVRKAKGAARVAWSKAVKRASVDVIVAGARRYAEDPNRDPEFTAHPATWLNADRWEDEPVARPLKVSKSTQGIAAWVEATT